MDGTAGSPRVIDVEEAARLLSLPEDGVRALAGAGYLRWADTAAASFVLGDVKAFLARVADDGGHVDVFSEQGDGVDPQGLLDALDGRAEEMARRAFDIFQQAFPEAAGWSLAERHQFVEQARRRFEAILAITEHGEDDELVAELHEVGATAAWAGSSLPQLLLVLRISRDLVVQTAVEVAEERGRHWGLALSLVLTRVLPAMDRLIDAIAQGYWAAMIAAEEEARARHESVVEHASDGVYELDLDGRIRYANPSLAVILGRRLEDLEGARLADVLVPADPAASLQRLVSLDAPRRVDLTIVRRDGLHRVLDILALPRRRGDDVAGYQGIVRDLTSTTELEAQKNEFLALITQDLRQPLTTILGLGVTLEGYAAELPAERVRNTGRSIRKQSERIARLADDLYDVSRIEAQELLLSSRPISLEPTMAAALFSVDGSDTVDLDVPDDLEVQADPRRLEQVVANLVENAVVHGSAPVRVTARLVEDSVEVCVADAGPGVPVAVVPTLFSRLHTVSRRDRDRTRGTGMGLSLVRGLVEAMGGRVWYSPGLAGGAEFRFTLPTPRVHGGR
ncbi:MAG: histidine kinase [Actinomycetia bacterium]|nr:histidine kinase [Actinomycetes bacterium]